MTFSVPVIIRRFLYDPVKTRVFYDLFVTFVIILTYQLLFQVFSLPILPWIIVLQYPFAIVFFNYLFGIYGRYKAVSVVSRVILLFLTVANAFFLFAFFYNFSFILVLASLATAFLIISPRVFFNFGNKANKSAYLNILVHDKQPILVVGGGGYIGSHVVEKLLQQHNKVRVFDKFLYGEHVLADLAKNPNLQIMKGDISDIFSLTLAVEGVQAVIHLAGLVGDPACAVDDKLTRHINIVSTRMLKESVKAFQIPRFIFASSCSVYGTSNSVVNENSNLNPVSLYAKTKIDAENEIMSDTYDHFHPTILRFSTVFGHSRKPRFDLVANLFSAQAHFDGKITVKGSRQWRPFIHVSDVAEAVVQTVKAPQEKISRQIFNVGDDNLNMTIGDVAATVAKVINKDKKGRRVRILTDDDVQDRRNYNVSFAKIADVLSFHAANTMEDGIKEMHKHFLAGTYKKPYKDQYYSNLEMTKEMIKEFYSEDYKKTHFSPIG